MTEPSGAHRGDAGGAQLVSLRRPADGLLARLALIASAERTIDLQYYLWDSDEVGHLMITRLLSAADRGVRIRVLVDDLKLRKRTYSIASLCRHPNLEIRVFNPWLKRSSAAGQAYEFIRRFQVLDLRTHNKLLVADGRRAIFGCRNIAAEHFGLGKTFNLVDYDMLVSGRNVSEAAEIFETYWRSPSTASGTSFNVGVSDDDLAATRASIAQELENCLPTLSTVLRDEDGWDERSAALRFPIAGGAVRVVSDRPGVSPLSQRTQVIDALHAAVDGAQRDLVVATPFFVPSEVQVDWYRRMIDRGVRIRVLTNSLASNQGTISNSGLKKQRRAMVKAGIELHELRTDAADKSEWDTPPREARYLGLHAKLCVIDRERVFLGAVNLDPRSRYINTEIGALIDNPEFAADAADGILELMTPDNAWRVELGGDGRLRWLSSTTTARRQPARGMMQRLVDAALGFLPVRKYT